MLKRFNRDRLNSLTQRLWKTKGAFALALMAIVLPACSSNELEAKTPAPNNVNTDATTPAARTNVTTEEVSNKTNALLGQTVTVRSEPVKKIGPNSFTISDEQFFGSQPILVLNASGKPMVLPQGDTEVQVTGKVTKFVRAELERDFDLDLDPEVQVEYENKPAIVAQSIALAPEAGEITKNPNKYYGKTIAVPAEVEEIVGPNAFTLDEDELIGGSDLLVLVANRKQKLAPLKEDEKVVATGVLRPFVVADIERDYDLTWDLNLQRKLEAEYSKKPVLITESVYPVSKEDTAK